MSKLITYSLLLMAFLVSGCAIRAKSYQVDRVDQEIKGNRGLIYGDVASLPAPKETKKTRTMYDIEIELPFPIGSKGKSVDVDITGNSGYMTKKQSLGQKSAPVVKKKLGTRRLGGLTNYKTPQVIYQQPKVISAESRTTQKKEIILLKDYVVKNGDTLQKISDKVYGTTKKWKKIYEANKDVLKGPDKIKPGQKIVIPE